MLVLARLKEVEMAALKALLGAGLCPEIIPGYSLAWFLVE